MSFQLHKTQVPYNFQNMVSTLEKGAHHPLKEEFLHATRLRLAILGEGGKV